MPVEASNLRALLGRAIRQRRRKRNLAQWQLAEIAGLSRAYVQRLETGQENVTIGTLTAIARALDAGIDEGIEVWDFFSDAHDLFEKAGSEAPGDDNDD